MINFICFCILILPWIFIQDPLRWGIDTVWFPKYIFLDLLFLISMGFMFLREPQTRYRNKPLGYFVIWCLLSFSYVWLSALVFPKIISGSYVVNFPLWNLIPSLHLILAVMFFLFLVIYLNDDEWQKILRCLGFSAVIMCVVALLQKMDFDIFKAIPHTYYSNNHFVAFMGNPNVAGSFCALCAPLFFGEKKLLPKVFLGILVLGVLCSLSLLGLMVLITSFLFWLSLSNKKRLFWIFSIGLFIFFILFFVFKPEFFNLAFRFEKRIPVWVFLFKQVELNPFLGYGLGSWSQLEYGKGTGSQWIWAHNDYLQMIYELGFVGLGLFAWVLIEFLKKIKTKLNVLSPLDINCISCVMGFLVLCIGMYPFQIAPLALAGLLPFAYLERRL